MNTDAFWFWFEEMKFTKQYPGVCLLSLVKYQKEQWKLVYDKTKWEQMAKKVNDHNDYVRKIIYKHL
jgi:hypothetical protein